MFSSKMCNNDTFGTVGSTDLLRNQMQYFTCPGDDFNVLLQGSGSSSKTTWGVIQISTCQPEILKVTHPNKPDWTCYNESKNVSEILAQTQVKIFVINKYFDVNDFSRNPVKGVMKPLIYSLGGN